MLVLGSAMGGVGECGSRGRTEGTLGLDMEDFDLPDADDFVDMAGDFVDGASDAEDNFGSSSRGRREYVPHLIFCKPGCNMCVMLLCR